MFSSLRIFGFSLGLIGLVLSFIFYRGPKWRRMNFVFSACFSVSLLLVSSNPNILNAIAEMLQLAMHQRGRILALLIASNFVIWIFFFYTKSLFDDMRHQIDLLLRRLGYEEAKNVLDKELFNKEIVIIIPAFNEEANLQELLSKIPRTIQRRSVGILVIDDGSTDNTAGVSCESGAVVVKNKINRGQGAASRLGYDVLVNYNIPIGVTMDADLQHSPLEIEKLVAPIINGEKDLVIGSRMMGAYRGSTLRKIGIRFFTRIINFLANVRLTDCSSGLKAFNVNALKCLQLKEDQFQSAEVILESAKKGLRIGEVSIIIHTRKYGITKKGTDWNYGFNFGKTIIKSWWK